ncbi:hypothetical protein BDZ97DRAFT_1784497 [Flammula alnicola]|nr:hypothetical protein BDZ97DRAFT_1784497 [Flammula alnicola]
MSTSSTRTRLTWIACVLPLAGISSSDGRLFKEVEQIYSDVHKLQKLLHDKLSGLSTPEAVYSVFYSTMRMKKRYGGVTHMYQLEEDMVNIANDLYLDLCSNKKSIKSLYIIAGESGAYLVLRLLKFMNDHGVDLKNGMPDTFPRLWYNSIYGRDEPTSSQSEGDIHIRYVILIRPSLPLPQGFAHAFWRIIQPAFYQYKDSNIEDLPCRFLWWTACETDSTSNVVIDMTLKGASCRATKMSDARAVGEKLEQALNIPPQGDRRREFVYSIMANLAKALDYSSNDALRKIEEWYKGDHDDLANYNDLVDLHLEAQELLGSNVSTDTTRDAFRKHLKSIADNLGMPAKAKWSGHQEKSQIRDRVT